MKGTNVQLQAIQKSDERDERKDFFHTEIFVLYSLSSSSWSSRQKMLCALSWSGSSGFLWRGNTVERCNNEVKLPPTHIEYLKTDSRLSLCCSSLEIWYIWNLLVVLEWVEWDAAAVSTRIFLHSFLSLGERVQTPLGAMKWDEIIKKSNFLLLALLLACCESFAGCELFSRTDRDERDERNKREGL